MGSIYSIVAGTVRSDFRVLLAALVVKVKVMEICVSIDRFAFCNITMAHCLLDSSDTCAQVWMYFETTTSNLVAKDDAFYHVWLHKCVVAYVMVTARLKISSGCPWQWRRRCPRPTSYKTFPL